MVERRLSECREKERESVSSSKDSVPFLPTPPGQPLYTHFRNISHPKSFVSHIPAYPGPLPACAHCIHVLSPSLSPFLLSYLEHYSMYGII